MAGFFVRATWPNGRFVNIDDYNCAGPAFASEQAAAEWLNRAAVRLRPQSLPRRPEWSPCRRQRWAQSQASTWRRSRESQSSTETLFSRRHGSDLRRWSFGGRWGRRRRLRRRTPLLIGRYCGG
jgi:hypothetical protein